jgi:hypothetical protein
LVSWCDGHCHWEYETDDLPAWIPVGHEVAEAEYLLDYGHPPFRWHSKLWPSGVSLEQNEFLPDTDPAYVAANGRLLITAMADPHDAGSARWWTKDDLPLRRTAATCAPNVSADIARAAAIAQNAADRLGFGH